MDIVGYTRIFMDMKGYHISFGDLGNLFGLIQKPISNDDIQRISRHIHDISNPYIHDP
jgi:hypothetical protein